MEGHAFDRIVKRLAARNISRRSTIRAGGGALAAAGLGAGGFTWVVAAQGVTATPATAFTTPVVALASTSFLFVQNFSGVRIEAKPASIP